MQLSVVAFVLFAIPQHVRPTYVKRPLPICKLRLMLSSLQNIVDHNQKTEETRLEARTKPCSFCNQRLGKYVCPRCNREYCSLACYQSRTHRACSEGFYRQQIKYKPEGMKTSEEERKKMEAILDKYDFRAPEGGGPLEFVGNPNTAAHEFLDMDNTELAEENGGGDDEEETDKESEEDEETVRRRKDLRMRMEGLNIEEADFEEMWERLDSREREEFVKLAQELEKEDKQGQAFVE